MLSQELDENLLDFSLSDKNNESTIVSENDNLRDRMKHISLLKEKAISETSFIDDNDSKTIIIRRKGRKDYMAPNVNIVDGEDNEDDKDGTEGTFLDVSEEGFRQAFLKTKEIEVRLKSLSMFNREIRENEIKKVRLIRQKVMKNYKRELNNDPKSLEIVNRTSINKGGSILFKPKDENGSLLNAKLILKPGKN